MHEEVTTCLPLNSLILPLLLLLTDIGRAVTGLKNEHPTMSILMVTHYKRLLDHIVPDKIHVMQKGQIVTSGGMDIVDMLESGGYAALSSSG